MISSQVRISENIEGKYQKGCCQHKEHGSCQHKIHRKYQHLKKYGVRLCFLLQMADNSASRFETTSTTTIFLKVYLCRQEFCQLFYPDMWFSIQNVYCKNRQVFLRYKISLKRIQRSTISLLTFLSIWYFNNSGYSYHVAWNTAVNW